MAPNGLGERVKRFLGIDPNDTLDDSAYYDDGSYIETEPSIKDLLLDFMPTLPGLIRYLHELFPFLGWIFHYNLTWLLGDVIAGKCLAFMWRVVG
jgi:sodium-independent sulfate anion transporter 11